MPIVEITMIEGRTPEAKRRLIAKVTDAIIEADRGAARFDPHHPARGPGATLRRRGQDEGKDRGAAETASHKSPKQKLQDREDMR